MIEKCTVKEIIGDNQILKFRKLVDMVRIFP